MIQIKEKTLLKTALISLVLLRFALALYYPVFSDANMYFYQAKRIALDPSLLINPAISYYPPLLFIMGAFIYTLIGDIGLKLIAPVFGAIGIFFAYRLGREIFDERTGLLAGIFLGIIPSHIYLSSMGYMDAIVTGLSIAFVYYFYTANTNKRIVYAGILAGLTAISKVTGVIVFIYLVVNFAVFYLMNIYKNIRQKNNIRYSLSHSFPKDMFKKSLITGVIGALISAPYYLRNLILFGNIMDPPGQTIHYARVFDPDVFNVELSTHMEVAYKATWGSGAGAFDYLKEIFFDFWGMPMRATNVISFIPDYVIYLFFGLVTVITLFYLVGTVRGILNINKKGILIICTWLLSWFLVTAPNLSALAWGFRRLLPIAPFIAIFAASEFDRVKPILKIRRIAWLLLILAIIVFPASQIGKAWYAERWFSTYSDSLQYLKGLPADSIVLTPYEEQTIYYSEKKTMMLPNLRPGAFNLTTFKRYNITHVVRTESFIWGDLSQQNTMIDKMADKNELKPLWKDRYVRIYKVVYPEKS